MKYILVLLVGLISSQALAMTYDIKTEIWMNGKLISSPRIITGPNEKASVSSKSEIGGNETSVEIVASEFSDSEVKDGIKMDMTVTYADGTNPTIIMRPSILARSGEAAEVSMDKSKNTEAFKIKVTATRSN